MDDPWICCASNSSHTLNWLAQFNIYIQVACLTGLLLLRTKSDILHTKWVNQGRNIVIKYYNTSIWYAPWYLDRLAYVWTAINSEKWPQVTFNVPAKSKWCNFLFHFSGKCTRLRRSRLQRIVHTSTHLLAPFQNPQYATFLSFHFHHPPWFVARVDLVGAYWTLQTLASLISWPSLANIQRAIEFVYIFFSYHVKLTHQIL